jgi:hypothetical protein
MARNAAPINAHLTHFIVDGSNIATEGRAVPSLKQLNEAVMAFIEEHPDALITVVVDATFGHRIDKKEVKSFDDAVANNELVTPPAGAVGRGDAFVLSIANKAKAGILSNDSFQEFHGDYGWLFEPGRLIGGKPVPHVGWVFVERLPVRGPKSRQAVKEANQPARPASTRAPRGTGSPLADRPLPVPSAPPPGPAPTAKAKVKRAAAETAAVVAAAAATVDNGAQQASRTTVNSLLPFLDFVEHHPIGTGCTVVVESYASHGAYARSGDVLVYVPLRLMGDPPPRSARSTLKIGEAVAVVIVGYVPERRSIDAALVSAADIAARAQTQAPEAPAVEAPQPATKRRSRSTQPTTQPATQPTPGEPAVSAASRRRRTSKAKVEAAAGAPDLSAQPEAPAAVPPAAKPAATRRTRRKAEPEAPAAVSPAPAAAPAPDPKPKPARKRAAKKVDTVTEAPVTPPVKPTKRAQRAPKATSNAEPAAPPKSAQKPATKRAAKPKQKEGSAG